MRFLRPKGLSDSNFKVDLFIAKVGGLEGESIPLVERMIQRESRIKIGIG